MVQVAQQFGRGGQRKLHEQTQARGWPVMGPAPSFGFTNATPGPNPRVNSCERNSTNSQASMKSHKRTQVSDCQKTEFVLFRNFTNSTQGSQLSVKSHEQTQTPGRSKMGFAAFRNFTNSHTEPNPWVNSPEQTQAPSLPKAALASFRNPANRRQRPRSHAKSHEQNAHGPPSRPTRDDEKGG